MGIVTRRYDFSESNSGKDICDRHISPMKSHICQHVNSGHDVENAADMKEALDSYCRVRGCRTSVFKVNTNAQEMRNHNWTGVQTSANFQFSEEGIKMWKAYNIGQGKFIKYDKLMKSGSSQGNTDLVVIDPLTSSRMSIGILHKSNKATSCCEFSCPRKGCIKMFHSNTSIKSFALPLIRQCIMG